jgi:hypothetical protein
MNNRNPSAVLLITGGVTGYFFSFSFFFFFTNARYNSFTAPLPAIGLFKGPTSLTDTNRTQIPPFLCSIGFYAGFRLNHILTAGKTARGINRDVHGEEGQLWRNTQNKFKLPARTAAQDASSCLRLTTRKTKSLMSTLCKAEQMTAKRA